MVNLIRDIPKHKAKHGTVDRLARIVNADNAKKTATDGCGDLPLHAACREGYDGFKLLKKLVEFYPEGLMHANGKGNLPIHIFVVNVLMRFVLKDVRGLEPLSFLFNKCPEALKVSNKVGDLPLHLAARKGAVKVFEFLIPKYPKAVTKPNVEGMLPCHLTKDPKILDLIGRFGPSSHQAVHQAHIQDQIEEYLQMTPQLPKYRFEYLQGLLNILHLSYQNSGTFVENGDEEKETAMAKVIKNFKDDQKEDAAIIKELKENQKKNDKVIQNLKAANVENEDEKKEMAGGIKKMLDVVEQLKNDQKEDATIIKELKENEQRHATVIQNLKAATAFDSATIAALDDKLKLETSYHMQTKACLLDTTKILLEAHLFQELKECLSLEDLVSILTLCNSQLTNLKEKVKPGSDPSYLQMYVKLAFSAKGVEMTKDGVCKVIADINGEIVALEKLDVIPATAVDIGTNAVARSIDMGIETTYATSESPNDNSRKRARTTISPS